MDTIKRYTSYTGEQLLAIAAVLALVVYLVGFVFPIASTVATVLVVVLAIVWAVSVVLTFVERIANPLAAVWHALLTAVSLALTLAAAYWFYTQALAFVSAGVPGFLTASLGNAVLAVLGVEVFARLPR